ncbi:hypothetical protein OAY83_00415 [Candidatus Marinimicrobia bacterium]|nr:hypothetical protein [Candidatus Neomarinimicrobiota bacterium]
MIFLRLFIFFVLLIPNGDHLLFNRITIQPTQAEFLSIYNPTPDTLDMSNYYLTDATRSSSDDYYYNLGSGVNFWSENFKDFIARFPNNYQIAPGDSLVLGLHNREIFFNYYGYNPDLTLFEDMRDAIINESTISINDDFVNTDMLGDDSEVLILFKWDGVIENPVEDIDYFLWGSTNDAIDKTGIANYLPDTSPSNQSFLYAHGLDSTYVRISNDNEGSEISLGGNGITGNDETSENLTDTWTVILAPEIVYGCTDSSACNYNSSANVENNTCWFANEGCSCDDEQNSIADCSGVCNGTAVLDCLGVCQGTAQFDICGVCDGPGSIYDCGCKNISLTEGQNPYEQCVDITIDDIYSQYSNQQCNNDFNGGIISTIGLIVDYEDITSSNGPRVITIQDPQGSQQLDVTIWDWDPANPNNGYHPDISNYINPYNPTQYYVIITGLLGAYNCGFQLDASDVGYGGVNINGTVTYFNQLNTNGNYQQNATINSARIDVAPYVLIPSIGERIDYSYSFPNNSRVIVRVFDISGRFITTLVDNFYDNSGTVFMQEDSSDWDGRDHLGQILSPGTYMMHIEAMNFQTGQTSTDIAPVVIGVKK